MQRLRSLDLLRGFDLFMLVAFCPLLMKFPSQAEWLVAIKSQFTHCSWEGFTAWDLVMPLFMFMSGVTIPFALTKYKNQAKGVIAWRIAKRVALLWVFGMVVQGNLLSLDPSQWKLFSNTLQAIAVGYAFSAIFFLNFSARTNYLIAASLLLLYWALMALGGDYSQAGNYAESVDRAVLGGFRDGAQWTEDGGVEFSPWYFYTWIISSLTFVVTVMSGMLAGDFLKNSAASGNGKAARLALAGVAAVAAGWIWGLWLPVIKPIWTSSMVMVSSGYSLLLLALFYWLADVKGWYKWIDWLRIYGTNSILAYVVSQLGLFRGTARVLLHGLEQYTGDYYPFILELGSVSIVFALLYIMFKNSKFLRV